MAKTLDTTPREEQPPIPAQGRKPERKPAGPGATRTIIPRHDDGRKWPFILVFAGNWEIGEIDGKPILLPVIDPHVTMPGSQNIKQRRKGQPPDAQKRDGAISEAGHVIFRGDDVIYAIEVQQDDDEKSTKFYYAPWDDVTEYPDGAVVVRFQPEVYNAWRADLLKRQAVPRPHEGHMQTLSRVLGTQIARASNHPDAQEIWKAKADRLRARLASLRPAYERAIALYQER